jgi:signal peptidase I
MAELSGSLTSIALGPLVRFLGGLNKSGDLLIERGHWIGQLSMVDGTLTAAAAERELGPDALAFVAAGLAGGEFEFIEGEPTLAPNLDPLADPLRDLERAVDSAPWARELPAPTAIPRRLDAASEVEDSELMLGRAAVYVLLDVDGQRTVREIATRHGLLRSLQALTALHENGLVAFTTPVPAPPPGELDETAAAAAPPSPRRRFRRPRGIPGLSAFSVFTEVVQAVLVAGVLVFVARAFVQNFRVDGVSMSPAFEAGQVLIVNRAAYFHLEGSPFERLLPATQAPISYLFGGPQRGDVAVFRAPPQPEVDYIKRVIGLPGERVRITNGVVHINGLPLEEPYIRFPADYTFPDDGEVLVPDASYFVLGDNRPQSFDSHLGWVVPFDYLVGRAWVRYWPPTAAAVVEPERPVVAASPRSP